MSPQDITDGVTIPHSEARMTESRKEGTRPDTRSTGRSVDWSDIVEDQPTEEAVLQISRVGHWFLEGWIGDHVVDSGSAVTALSCKFYQTLLSAGAPGAWECYDPRTEGCEVLMVQRSRSWDVRLAWCHFWDSGRSSQFWCAT